MEICEANLGSRPEPYSGSFRGCLVHNLAEENANGLLAFRIKVLFSDNISTKLRK